MILELVAIAVLAVVVFAFVLEPVLRARSDRVILDSIALPRSAEEIGDDLEDDLSRMEPDELPERSAGGRVAYDRPVSSDIS